MWVKEARRKSRSADLFLGFVLSFGLLSGLNSLSAQAQGEAAAPLTGPTRTEMEYKPFSRDWIFFGVSGGYAGVVPYVNMPENGKDGYFFSGKASYSHYFRDFVIDLGGGFLYSSVKGNNTNNPFYPANTNVTVTTRAGFVELAPRLRVTENINIGPVGQMLFGPDVTFDELINARNTSISFFAGGRFEYDTLTEGSDFRFGATVLTDVLLSGRQVWLLGLDASIGIPFLGKSGNSEDAARAKAYEQQQLTERQERERLEAIQREEQDRLRTQVESGNGTGAEAAVSAQRPATPKFAETMSKEVVKIYLGEAVMRFQSGSANLRATAKKTVSKLGSYLAQNPTKYKLIRVEGHSDKTGSLALNDRLSASRALTVASALESLGVPKQKISARGFGPRRPVDPANDKEAFTVNRRVEIWLDGVTEPEAVAEELNRLTL